VQNKCVSDLSVVQRVLWSCLRCSVHSHRPCCVLPAQEHEFLLSVGTSLWKWIQFRRSMMLCWCCGLPACISQLWRNCSNSTEILGLLQQSQDLQVSSLAYIDSVCYTLNGYLGHYFIFRVIVIGQNNDSVDTWCWLNVQLTVTIEQSHSGGSVSSSASQGTSAFYVTWTFKSVQLLPVLSQINPVCALPTCFRLCRGSGS